ncbi:MAG: hypothetical protein PHU93_01420 [Candidatus Gracilibacteria bacterium]|nr:hypothetical protein [Candidatus Gracilibacteria bacterium]
MSQTVDRIAARDINETRNAQQLQKALEKLPPAQRTKVAEAIAQDSRFSKLMSHTASVAGSAWKGWEHGVNSAVNAIGAGMNDAGKFIGESTAIAVHGKEGEFLEHAMQKTEWIRKGLDATGEFVGTSAAVIAEAPISDTLSSTANYWGSAYEQAKTSGKKMSAEEIAYASGNVAGNVAVGAVTGYALKHVQLVNALNKNMTLGSKLSSVDASISQGAQLGVEFLGGNHLKSGQRMKMPIHPVNPHTSETHKPSREQVIAHAKMGDHERLQKAESILRDKGLLQDTESLKKLGLLDNTGQLTQAAQDRILRGHSAGGKAVFEQDFGSIRAKARASEELPKSWKKELMDQGIMGTERTTILASPAFEQLKKTDRILANQLESFMDPARMLRFPTGSMGGDWAKEIITSTLDPLAKAKGKLSPELFAQVQAETLGNVESQLKTTIMYRLDGKREWIEQIGVGECFEKLSAKGFHVNPDIFPSSGSTARIKPELDQVLHRARISSAGEKSLERITGLRAEMTQERKALCQKLTSPTLTEIEFDSLKGQLVVKRQMLEQKLDELKGLQAKLGELKNTSAQESDGIRNIKGAINGLQDELTILTRWEKGTEMATAQKTLQNHKSESLRLAAEKELQEKMNRGFFALSPEQRTELVISPQGALLSQSNRERYFYVNYPDLDAATKNKFTPEVMNKFGTYEKNMVFNDQFLDLTESARAQLILGGHAPQMNKDNWERFFYFNFHLLDPRVQAKFTPPVLEKIYATLDPKVISKDSWELLTAKYANAEV